MTTIETTGELVVLAAAPAIGLVELERDAALLTRVDRKYVLAPDHLAGALQLVAGDLRVLEIDGHRSFGYRSTYFDTAELDLFRAAATGRPRRCKVRTRTYLDSGSAWVEVKLRNRGGRTVKCRLEHANTGVGHLDAHSAAFVESMAPLSLHADDLRPTLITSYRRTTLLADQRVTIDTDLTWLDLDGAVVARLAGDLVVETKSADRRPGGVDRALWQVGIRPIRLSKYALGVATMHPGLPANRWHRALTRYVRTDAMSIPHPTEAP